MFDFLLDRGFPTSKKSPGPRLRQSSCERSWRSRAPAARGFDPKRGRSLGVTKGLDTSNSEAKGG